MWALNAFTCILIRATHRWQESKVTIEAILKWHGYMLRYVPEWMNEWMNGNKLFIFSTKNTRSIQGAVGRAPFPLHSNYQNIQTSKQNSPWALILERVPIPGKHTESDNWFMFRRQIIHTVTPPMGTFWLLSWVHLVILLHLPAESWMSSITTAKNMLTTFQDLYHFHIVIETSPLIFIPL